MGARGDSSIYPGSRPSKSVRDIGRQRLHLPRQISRYLESMQARAV